jgi:GAF domain-containing protein
MTGMRSIDEILDDAGFGEDHHDSTAALDVGAALAELAGIDLRSDDLPRILRRIAELAQKTLPGAEEVSVSLVGSRAAGVTPAYTGPMAVNADELQYAGRSGPCLEAAATGQPVLVEDLATEQRWPEYVPRARAAGVASSVSIPLPVHQTITGALNVYAARAYAFDETTVEAAHVFAGCATIALANAQLYETTAAVARQMEQAIASRAVIEQAKGVIMGQRRCTADEAFEHLVRASSRGNRRLRDIAAELITSTQRR